MCQVCLVITNLRAQLDVSPDDLYSNSTTFEIKIDSIKDSLNNEFNDLQKGPKNKVHDIQVDCNDKYFYLKRLLARDQEYTEDNADHKQRVSLLWISSNVLVVLLEYLNSIVRD